MEQPDLVLREKKIVGDISYNFEVYKLDDLCTEAEISEGVGLLSECAKHYRHLHVELKSLLGENYDGQYPHYEDMCTRVTTYLKSARDKLREIQGRYQTDKTSDEKYRFNVEFEVLCEKVLRVNDFVDVQSIQNDNEIDKYVTKMEGFIDEYFGLTTKVKCSCLDLKEKQSFDREFMISIVEIQHDIRIAGLLKSKLKEVQVNFENVKVFQNKQLKSVTMAENLKTEICYRFESLAKNFSVDLSELGDYQILELHQGKKHLDMEFNSIMEKITELASLVSLGGDKIELLFRKASKTRDRLSQKRETYFAKLFEIVLERDITVDKLKCASELTIEVPKFSGYDGKIDIYTFKTEFKKLVEPKLQKKYYADYLKRNYLSGSAFTLVEKETNYEKIWQRLFDSFGNTRLLLQNKLSSLNKFALCNVRGEQKISSMLASLVNTMQDLSILAAEHNIEGQLYEGGGPEKILSLIGESRHRKYRSQNLGHEYTKKQDWQKLREFLEKDLRLREKMTLDHKTAEQLGLTQKRENPAKVNLSENIDSHDVDMTSGTSQCHICGKGGHTVITTSRGNKIIPYYVCEIFVKMSHDERLSKMDSKNLCTICLFPGAVKGPKHKCLFTNFCCPSHEKNDKIHVLLCNKHKGDEKNVKLGKKFKERFIDKCPVPLPKFVELLTFFSGIVAFGDSDKKPVESIGKHTGIPDVVDSAIFQLQRVQIDNVSANVFFDNGCGGLIIKESFAQKLVKLGRAEKIEMVPFDITGVGDQKSLCTGLYRICLTLHDGQNAILTGVTLPKITSDFPMYDLTEVEKDIREKCFKIGGKRLVSCLPKLSKHVGGGDTDLLIGCKYLRYFPEEVKKFDTGLKIFQSVFMGTDRTRGVLNGPHPSFAQFERRSGHEAHLSKFAYYLAPTIQLISMWKIENDMPLLGERVKPTMNDVEVPICCDYSDQARMPEGSFCANSTICVSQKPIEKAVHFAKKRKFQEYFCANSICLSKKPIKKAKTFDELEISGTSVTFRCPDCRSCKKCKNGPRIESISIQDEIEQNMIEKCVNVDIELEITMSKLPFLVDPDKHLGPNEHVALRVFNTQLQKLNSKPEDKKSVLEFEKKLQDLGCVEYVSNLNPVEKNQILNSGVKYFLPWRPFWNLNSTTTPCRMVFDASMSSRNSCSLNSILAKGANSLNNLLGIMIRWTVHQNAFHTDVQKMYNRVNLDPSHWRYQLYLFSENLNMGDIPQWKVVKTLIYGVRPSGGLAECGLRRTVELCKEVYPLAYIPITHDTYMDDCASGTSSLKQTLRVTNQIQAAVGKGGFSLKGFTVSGKDPPEHLTEDGKSVTVLGLRWFPKGDFIKLNIGQMNFARKERGKKSAFRVGQIPDNLTLRDCVSRTSEVFDPLGRVAPILAGIKLDISVLHKRCIGWDDPIPTELKTIWAANFDLIDEIGKLKFQRAIVPSDALNLDIETINTADASEHLVCAAVYARFLKRDGSHSCQLIFARTKIVHGLTIPRAELTAAELNASTSHVVRMSLKDYHKRSWHITDSQVVLHWIHSLNAALKMFVRNRTVEISRLTETSNWFFTESENMIADLGTRKGAKIEDVNSKSFWNNGILWMHGDEKYFPLKTVHDLILSAKEKSEANVEKVMPEAHNRCLHVTRYVPQEVEKRYNYSKYLLNPNKYRWRTVVRVLALVFLFIKKLSIKRENRKKKMKFLEVQEHESKTQYSVFEVFAATNDKIINVAVVQLHQDFLQAAQNYYFRKAALEVQKFVEPSRYKHKSMMKNGILYFTGRILRTQKIDGNFGLSDAMLDLSEATFCVPMTDSCSPIAYALVSETHWYDPDVKHLGVESTLRYAQKVAYIIGGRNLVKGIQKDCTRCRILHKKGVRIAMGPIGEENLMVAPPFYFTQVDLCGPFNAYSPANKRATLKIWIVVFCCTVTGTVDCRVMEDYSTDSFVLSFVRFSCRFGYPKMLLPDEGSQLVKGCKDMILSFSDLNHQLFTEYGVEFKTCPVGAHYVHGKVERKIQQIKLSLEKCVDKRRLSVVQWETLGQQVSNSINNLPLGLGNKTECLETLDLLTPNRLLLGRNNSRSPTMPLELTEDYKSVVANNSKIFDAWFKEWLINYVPHIVEQPKWFVTERHVSIGDVVLFTKSEKEFDKTYQYGIIVTTFEGRDGLVREITIEYRNHNENAKRTTRRGVRDIVVIHPVEEIGIAAELYNFSQNAEKIDRS